MDHVHEVGGPAGLRHRALGPYPFEGREWIEMRRQRPLAARPGRSVVKSLEWCSDGRGFTVGVLGGGGLDDEPVFGVNEARGGSK
jgi:hypothetical protein